MDININNFFGIDLAKEPNEKWVGYNKSKEGTCSRRKGRNAKFEMCMADISKKNIVIVFSNRLKVEYLELIDMFKQSKENGHIKYSYIKDGFEFYVIEEFVQYLMLIIQKL